MGADDVAVWSRDTVPMIGPRSRAVPMPHWIGRALPPGSGWEVRRMWSVRLDVMFGSF